MSDAPSRNHMRNLVKVGLFALAWVIAADIIDFTLQHDDTGMITLLVLGILCWLPAILKLKDIPSIFRDENPDDKTND